MIIDSRAPTIINNTTNNMNTTNNTMNNNITNNIDYNTINILKYDESDTTHLKHSDYLDILMNDTFNSMVRMLTLINMNPEKPENMNLLLVNLRDLQMKVYNDNEWEKVLTDEQLGDIIDKQFRLIADWFGKHEHKSTDLEIKRWGRLYDNVMEKGQEIKKKMATALYNHKNMILENSNKIKDAEKTKQKAIEKANKKLKAIKVI
jgi:hypothetical protein